MDLIKSLLVMLVILFSGCSEHPEKKSSVQLLTDETKQVKLFHQLVGLTDTTIFKTSNQDTIAFLVLPLDASCPACRDKAIDSIIKTKGVLLPHHYIILSSNRGVKNLKNFFQENAHDFPLQKDKMFIDSNNNAFKSDLYIDNPTMYYAANGRVFQSVLSNPSTIKQDLREFFSGDRIK